MFLLLIVCTQQFRWWHGAEGSNHFHGAKLERGSETGQRSCVEECPLLSGLCMED